MDGWARQLVTLAAAVGLIAATHSYFVRPSIIDEVRTIVDARVDQRLDEIAAARAEQIDGIQESLDTITERIERFDSALGEQIRTLSEQMHGLSKALDGK